MKLWLVLTFTSPVQAQLLNKQGLERNIHNNELGPEVSRFSADPRGRLSNSHSVFQAEEILILFSTNSWFGSKSDRPATTLWHTIHRRNPLWLLNQPCPNCVNHQEQELEAA